MSQVDTRRSTCLPVFDPCYKPNGRRIRFPLLLQQQQQPEHRPSAQGYGGKDLYQKPDKISRDAIKMSEDARRQKTKILKGVKVVRWRSLNGNARQRHSNNDESVTEGKP